MLSEADAAAVSAQLGRSVRGAATVAWRCPCGRPGVVATAPRLPDGTPFPTLYYLTCPRATAGCSRLEADGLMVQMAQRLGSDPELAQAYAQAHVAYLADRDRAGVDEGVGPVPEIDLVSAGGMPARVKCLHALAAHALAAGPGVNPLGDETVRALGPFWRQPCLPDGELPPAVGPKAARPAGAGRADVDAGEGPVVAGIDCGTNSVRLLIARSDGRGGLIQIDRVTCITRLGQGVDGAGVFAPEALERTFTALDDFAVRIAAAGVQSTRCVATSAARDVRNRDEFAAGVRQRLHVRPQVISGEEEARLSFLGAVTGVPDATPPMLVMDIGGGSTELVIGRVGADGPQVAEAISLDIGAVRVTERFWHSDPPSEVDSGLAAEHIDRLLDAADLPFGEVATWIGVSGTITSLAAIGLQLPRYDRALVDGTRLPLEQLQSLAHQVRTSSSDELRTIPSLHPGRADVIGAGALIAERISRRLPVGEIVVSESDILDGIVLDLLG